MSPHAVSSALIIEERKIQKHVYYTSRALRKAKGRYPMMEKLAFALVISSSKLRHYFQAHVINILTNHPLKKAMNKLEVTGRLIQWAIELSEFDIKYQLRSAIKAQTLADFIAEFTLNHGELDEVDEAKKWVVYVDGSSTQYAGGIGVVLKSPERDKLKYATCLQYQTTNNEVKYEALLKGLELAKSLRAESIVVQGDFQLAMGQVYGTCEIKEERMKKYLSKMKRLLKKFKEASFLQVPREENMEANALAKTISADGSVDEYDKVQYMPSIDLLEVQQIEEREN
ncbi:uncharacterized protein LOC142644088 [Castanea sativa]|uniref:uncharacterized protein LOC142644088 n=1 Tax=Castanea sativa TaxID=21020 RepID=UPI003F650E48